MSSRRLIYRFPDGKREMRERNAAPEIGDRVTRHGKEWVVIALREHGDIIIVALHRAPADGHRPR